MEKPDNDYLSQVSKVSIGIHKPSADSVYSL